MFVPLWVFGLILLMLAFLVLEWSVNIDGPAGCFPMLLAVGMFVAAGAMLLAGFHG